MTLTLDSVNNFFVFDAPPSQSSSGAIHHVISRMDISTRTSAQLSSAPLNLSIILSRHLGSHLEAKIIAKPSIIMPIRLEDGQEFLEQGIELAGDAGDAVVEGGRRFWSGFQDFVLKDNVLEVAVGLM